MTYTVSYSAPTGHYALDRGAFAAARTAGPVRFPADAGVYQYGGGFPTEAAVDELLREADRHAGREHAAGGGARRRPGRPVVAVDRSTEIEERVADDTARVELGVRFKVDAPAAGA